MTWFTVSRSCGTVFDIATKQSLRTNLNTQMGQPSFWDNPERAQQVIQKLKPLNALLKPAEDLQSATGDLQVLAELAEEDTGLEAELEGELTTFEERLGDFEMRAMLSGPYDAGN